MGALYKTRSYPSDGLFKVLGQEHGKHTKLPLHIHHCQMNWNHDCVADTLEIKEQLNMREAQ
jgi:hypothetical protein